MKRDSRLNRFGAEYLNDNGTIESNRKWKTRETGGTHTAKQGEVYPYGYDATFYPHRLQEPIKEKRGGKVFVVDVGDLFGAWVPKDWIDQVLEITKQCPQHIFQFLTKKPKRFLEFKFGENCWVGTSVNSNEDTERAEILKKISAPVRYLSIEPLLGEISFDLTGLEWLIVGAQTGKNPSLPDNKWVDNILSRAAQLSIPVFMKDNLKQCYKQQLIKNYPLNIYLPKHLKINPEFQKLISDLTNEEYKLLQENIEKEGCRDKIVTWNDTIIDGHNRYKICSKLNLKFTVEEKDFSSQDEAITWIINNQLGRRNLTDTQKTYLIGEKYNRGEKQGDRTDLTLRQNVPKLTTAEQIGQEYKISVTPK